MAEKMFDIVLEQRSNPPWKAFHCYCSYWNGVRGFDDGVAPSECPYPLYSNFAKYWFEGYADAWVTSMKEDAPAEPVKRMMMSERVCDWTTPDAREFLKKLHYEAGRIHGISTFPLIADTNAAVPCVRWAVGYGGYQVNSKAEAGFVAAMSEALPQLLDRLDKLEDVLRFQLTLIGKQAINIHQQAAEIERLKSELSRQKQSHSGPGWGE